MEDIDMLTINEELKKINRPLYILSLIILIGAVCIVAGIIKGITALWISGIVIIFLFSIYGIPIVWLRNIEKKKKFRMGEFILEHESTPLSMLAGSVGVSESVALDNVRWLLTNGYLPGYIIDGNTVTLSKLVDPNMQEHTAICPNCGASFTYVGKIGQCPYCGDYYPPNTHKQ